jgi:hypothetical protein
MPFIIQHYGVKGMRWGVRRDRPSGGRRSLGQRAKGYLKRKKAEREEFKKKILSDPKFRNKIIKRDAAISAVSTFLVSAVAGKALGAPTSTTLAISGKAASLAGLTSVGLNAFGYADLKITEAAQKKYNF